MSGKRAAALEHAIVTLHLYSRRYCDGRQTYAVDDHNRVTHHLLRMGVELPIDPISSTGPFASDGQFGLRGQELSVLERWPSPERLHALAVAASNPHGTRASTKAALDELVSECLKLGET